MQRCKTWLRDTLKSKRKLAFLWLGGIFAVATVWCYTGNSTAMIWPSIILWMTYYQFYERSFWAIYGHYYILPQFGIPYTYGYFCGPAVTFTILAILRLSHGGLNWFENLLFILAACVGLRVIWQFVRVFWFLIDRYHDAIQLLWRIRTAKKLGINLDDEFWRELCDFLGTDAAPSRGGRSENH